MLLFIDWLPTLIFILDRLLVSLRSIIALIIAIILLLAISNAHLTNILGDLRHIIHEQIIVIFFLFSLLFWCIAILVLKIRLPLVLHEYAALGCLRLAQDVSRVLQRGDEMAVRLQTTDWRFRGV